MSLLAFVKRNMLVVSMAAGISAYLLYHFTTFLRPVGPICYHIAADGQPIALSIMLFLEFVMVAPDDLEFHRWHVKLLAFQTLFFLFFAIAAILLPQGGARLLCECAMLCFICPTAGAAGVITLRLGGKQSATLMYMALANLLASVIIPLIIPIVNPGSGSGFLESFLAILCRVFSILLLPCALAWAIRYFLPGLQRRLERISGWSFYIWSITLSLSLALGTRALVQSHISFLLALAIGLVSFAACIFQFASGRHIARSYGRADSITAGQVLGQKNTGFLIWLGLGYFTPVTSVAGAFYALWHNLVNTYELSHNDKNNNIGIL